MQSKRTALIVGAFQPPCRRHLALFDRASELSENILVAIRMEGTASFLLSLGNLNALNVYRHSFFLEKKEIAAWVNSLGSRYGKVSSIGFFDEPDAGSFFRNAASATDISQSNKSNFVLVTSNPRYARIFQDNGVEVDFVRTNYAPGYLLDSEIVYRLNLTQRKKLRQFERLKENAA